MGLDWVCSSMVGHLLCIIVKKKKKVIDPTPHKKKKKQVSQFLPKQWIRTHKSPQMILHTAA